MLLKVSEYSCQPTKFHSTLDVIGYKLYWRPPQFLPQFLHRFQQVRQWHIIHSPLPVREMHFNYRAMSLIHSGECSCQLQTRKVTGWTIPSPAEEKWKTKFVPISENALLRQLQNHKETGISFTSFFGDLQIVVQVTGKLKPHPPLLSGQLLKYLCHLLLQIVMIYTTHLRVMDAELPNKPYKLPVACTEMQLT